MPARPEHLAFTLIELLVVITVIVVLLALLAPAMDKAIYQAELAVCAAQLRTIAGGASTYTMDSKRFYPYRRGARAGQVWMPSLIYNGNQGFNGFWGGLSSTFDDGAPSTDVYDDRPMLKPYMDLKVLSDPFVDALDMDGGADIDSHVFSSVSLWFGFGHPGYRGMYRLGDRWTAPELPTTDPLRSPGRYEIVAADMDIATANSVQSTHADARGMLVKNTYRNDWFWDGFKAVWSVWEGKTNRGVMDMNFAYQNGSVARRNDVAPFDPDMARVRYYNYNLGWYASMPPQP